MENKICSPKIVPAATSRPASSTCRSDPARTCSTPTSTTTGSVYTFTKNEDHWDAANYPYQNLVVKVITNDDGRRRPR